MSLRIWRYRNPYYYYNYYRPTRVFYFSIIAIFIGIPSRSLWGGVTGEPENHNSGNDERSCGRGILVKKGAGMLSNYDQLCAVGLT